MRKVFLICFIAVLLLTCKKTPNTQAAGDTPINPARLVAQDTFFMYIPGDIFGILDGNTLEFSHIENQTLTKLPDMELTLPDGYESVFEIISYRGAIGVVVDHAAHFFFYDKAVGWTEDKDSEFPLPGGYKDVFMFIDEIIGVVVDNTVQFYRYSDNSWDEIPFLECTLPGGYKSVFNYSTDEVFRIGVVVGNTIKFYYFALDYFDWLEQQEMELTLPGDYKRVFKYYLEETHIIMVAVTDDVLFYVYYDGQGWLSGER